MRPRHRRKTLLPSTPYIFDVAAGAIACHAFSEYNAFSEATGWLEHTAGKMALREGDPTAMRVLDALSESRFGYEPDFSKRIAELKRFAPAPRGAKTNVWGGVVRIKPQDTSAVLKKAQRTIDNFVLNVGQKSKALSFREGWWDFYSKFVDQMHGVKLAAKDLGTNAFIRSSLMRGIPGRVTAYIEKGVGHFEGATWKKERCPRTRGAMSSST